MKVYLDANVFICAAISSPELRTQAVAIIQAVQEEKVEALTSILTWDEVVYVIKKLDTTSAAIEAGFAFLNFSQLQIVNATKNTGLEALEAIREHKLLPRDAIHYATMKIENITEIVSEDSDFDKIKTIKRYSIKEFSEKINKLH
ncbi:MAG: type II toxin-antitoxin system VapC family toxin [Candidatus Diapherotrites archaeon]|nr:type II toxin-antitoxin system VapC family toxin [Candidatus Diapherotrites archaeon]